MDRNGQVGATPGVGPGVGSGRLGLHLDLLHEQHQAFALHLEGELQFLELGAQRCGFPFLLESVPLFFQGTAQLFFLALVTLSLQCGPLIDGFSEQLVFPFQGCPQGIAAVAFIQAGAGTLEGGIQDGPVYLEIRYTVQVAGQAQA